MFRISALLILLGSVGCEKSGPQPRPGISQETSQSSFSLETEHSVSISILEGDHDLVQQTKEAQRDGATALDISLDQRSEASMCELARLGVTLPMNVDLSNGVLTPETLNCLSQLDIRKLTVTMSSISGDFPRLPHLNSLHLLGTVFSQQLLDSVGKHNANTLRHLQLSQRNESTPIDLRPLRRLQKLRHFSLAHKSSNVADFLASQPQLETVLISEPTQASIDALESITQLQSVTISGNIFSLSIAPLAKLPRLKTLLLLPQQADVPKNYLVSLRDAKQLEVLALTDVRINSATANDILRIPSLQTVSVDRDKLTDLAREKIINTKPSLLQ